MKERIQEVIDGWKEELRVLCKVHKQSGDPKIVEKREVRIELLERNLRELEGLLKPKERQESNNPYIPEIWY